MEFWEGFMNWPLVQDWKCETCGESALQWGLINESALQWGLINGQCRCCHCHTQYMMREEERILTTPKCMLKDEYKEPAKKAWIALHIPVDELEDSQWDEFMVKEEA